MLLVTLKEWKQRGQENIFMLREAEQSVEQDLFVLGYPIFSL